MIMIEGTTKELYDAPQVHHSPLAKSPSLLISFSIEGKLEDIAEDDSEW